MIAAAAFALLIGAAAGPAVVRADGCAVLGDDTFNKWTYCSQNTTLKGMNLGYKGPSANFDNEDTEASTKWEHIDLDTSKAKVDWSKQSTACKLAYMNLACAWEIKPCKTPGATTDVQKSINGGLRDDVLSACVDQSGAEIWTKPFPDDYRNSAFIFGLPTGSCLPDGTDCPEGVKANAASCTLAKECMSGICTSGSCVGKAKDASCTKAGECKSGACTASKCALLADGASCDANDQCTSNMCSTSAGSGSDMKCMKSGAVRAVFSSALALLVAATAYAMA